MKPTLEAIMATQPCRECPRERVEALLAQYGPFDSWVALAERARAEGWPVELDLLLLTACRMATPEQLAAAAAFSASAFGDNAAWDTLLFTCRILDGVEPC